MLRVIFDTNVYGNLSLEKDADALVKRIKEERDFIVYGYTLIRQKIRAIPKVSKLSRRTRVRLLGLYDSITGNHFLQNSLAITSLARRYYDSYRTQGGIYSWNTSIQADFMIVACATLHSLDIIYSDDGRTMLGKPAMKAYKHINLKENLRLPTFLTYEDLLLKFRNL